MISVLVFALYLFERVFLALLVARALFSWFVQPGSYSSIGKSFEWLIRITEPIVSPCRALLDKAGLRTGMLDFSVFLAMILVTAVCRLLAVGLLRLA